MSCQPGEKLCPFCFEVIKQQAIRCKHCQADLSGGEISEANYLTTGAAHGFTMGGQGHRIEGGVHIITTLSELDDLEPATKAELLAKYEQKVRDHPENAKYHFALGLSYLDRRLYDLAVTSFKRALGKGLREADLYYYLALAAIGGRQPRSLALSRIKEIEAFLEAAVRQDGGSPHCKALWALVKHDYYLSNGLRVPPPSIQDLLSTIVDHPIDQDELRLITKHVPVPASPLARAMRL
jgi:tetratricopeptide (TPR) repeat protein